MLEGWDKLSPNEPRLTSLQKAILCHGPDQGLSRENHPAPPLPLPSPPFIPRAKCHSPGFYSGLSSSTVSSVGCWRLRTWYLGLPLVHHPPCGVSGLTQPDAHRGPRAKRVAVLPRPPAQSTGTLAGCGFSPTPLFSPHPRPRAGEVYLSLLRPCVR